MWPVAGIKCDLWMLPITCKSVDIPFLWEYHFSNALIPFPCNLAKTIDSSHLHFHSAVLTSQL